MTIFLLEGGHCCLLGGFVYLLYLDESGTHDKTRPFVLGGIAAHERDVPHLSKRIESSLTYHLAPAGLDPKDYELHASVMKNGRDEWEKVPGDLRTRILGSIYKSIATYGSVDPRYPVLTYGAVVDGVYPDQENRAYELVLNKFDEHLSQINRATSNKQNGLVIHDRRIVDSKNLSDARNLERRIQEWTRRWQMVAGRVGQLYNLADIPFFADSRSSRMLQAADFVSWSLWRYYGLTKPDERWVRSLWPLFTAATGEMHSLIHVSPAYAHGTCPCPPCKKRLNTTAPV
jgi:hypothetical protein